MDLYANGKFFCKIKDIWIDLKDIMHADEFKAMGKGFIQQWFHYHILTDCEPVAGTLNPYHLVLDDGKKIGVRIHFVEKKEGDKALFDSVIYSPERFDLPKNEV